MIKDLIKDLASDNNYAIIKKAFTKPVEFYGIFTVRGSRLLGRKRIIKLIEICSISKGNIVADQIYNAIASAGWLERIEKEIVKESAAAAVDIVARLQGRK